MTHGTASFDVFDTLLVRPVLFPQDVFRLVEQETALRGWATARIQAERRARMRVDCREVTLDEIYRAFGPGAWNGRLEECRQRELAWEQRACVAPSARGEVAAARAEGRQVAFVSDMYLPESYFRERLGGVLAEGDALVLSHAEKDSKGRTLWSKLRRRFSEPWTHVGDNPSADVHAPRRYGIDARQWTEALPTRRELQLYSHSRSGMLAAGSARLSRVLMPPAVHPAWRLGANVAGPVVHAFASWTLAEARRRGIECLYYLSRDGELPFRMAAEMRARNPDLPEVRYLLGSRHAWYNAVFDIRNDRHRRWVRFAAKPTVRGVLANVMTDPAALARSLAAVGFGPDRWDEALTERQRLALLARLAADPDVAAWFDRRREAKSTLLLEYLAQEGVFAHRSVALVDVGWSGSMVDCFADALALAPDPRPAITGLFFGLHARPVRAEAAAMLFAPRIWNHWARQFPSVIEMLVPGSHGQVIGYTRAAAGVIQPELHDQTIAPPELIDALHGGALEFSRLAHAHGLESYEWAPMLKEFLEFPEANERMIMRQFRFETWQGPENNALATLIPALSIAQLAKRSLSPYRQVQAWPWPQASWLGALPRTPRVWLRALTWKLQVDLAAWVLVAWLRAATVSLVRHTRSSWRVAR